MTIGERGNNAAPRQDLKTSAMPIAAAEAAPRRSKGNRTMKPGPGTVRFARSSRLRFPCECILFGTLSFALLNWLKMVSSSRDAEKLPVAKSQHVVDKNSVPLSSLLSISIWFGVVAGVGEGVGLLLFQRINWRQWARVMHVSKEILWISPLVDLCLFLLVGFAVAIVARIF